MCDSTFLAKHMNLIRNNFKKLITFLVVYLLSNFKMVLKSNSIFNFQYSFHSVFSEKNTRENI
jgi:hypothetical protein